MVSSTHWRPPLGQCSTAARRTSKLNSVVRPLISGCREILNHIFSMCTGHLLRIYRGITYGPEGNSSFTSLMRQQLPRPRTIRQLWDISLKLSGAGVKKAAPCHVTRSIVMAITVIFTLPDACTRRGCEKKSTAKCAKCKLGYCGIDCQKRCVSCRVLFT